MKMLKCLRLLNNFCAANKFVCVCEIHEIMLNICIIIYKSLFRVEIDIFLICIDICNHTEKCEKCMNAIISTLFLIIKCSFESWKQHIRYGFM